MGCVGNWGLFGKLGVVLGVGGCVGVGSSVDSWGQCGELWVVLEFRVVQGVQGFAESWRVEGCAESLGIEGCVHRLISRDRPTKTGRLCLCSPFFYVAALNVRI